MSNAVHHHHYHQLEGVPRLSFGAQEVCVATFANGHYHSVYADLETAKRNLRNYHGTHLTFHNENGGVKVVANYDDGGTATLYRLHPHEEVRR